LLQAEASRPAAKAQHILQAAEAAQHEGNGDDRQNRYPQCQRAQAVGESLGDHDVRPAQPRKEQQAERPFPPFAADAIGREQGHDDPDRAEKCEVETAE